MLLAHAIETPDKVRAGVDGDFNGEEWRRWEAAQLERARRGDREAFAALYRAFAPPLFAQILLPRIGDRALAEDALAETFRTMLERIDDYTPQGKSIWFWLVRIAMNKAHDMHRGRARGDRALASFEGMLAVVLPPPVTPRDEVLRREDEARVRTRVEQVLSRINARYRDAITHRLLEERSREECAALLEVKVATFDVLFLRAVRAFRAEWQSGADGDNPTEES